MKNIIIIGAGGNSKVIADIIHERIKIGEELEIIGFLDDNDLKKEFQSYPVVGPISMINALRHDKQIWFVNGIGNNGIRRELYHQYGDDLQYLTVIHPSVIIGSGVNIGSGSIVMPGVIINSGTNVGKQVIVNTGAVLEHDNIIEDFSHIASGTVTAGNVHVGECSMLGTGTRVIQGICIGSNVMLGAGAVVIGDICDNCTAVGIPAKIIKTF